MKDWYPTGFPHIWQPYAQAKIAPEPLPVSHTDGCHIVLADGRRLIDGISSWWCIPHGHNHPHLVEAAKRQLEVMPHVMFAGLAHEPAYMLAERLSKLTPGQGALSRVFFSDSGSTSVEVALKMALQYWANQGNTKKTRFACLEQAYHGDTFGAMSVSDPVRGMHAAYRPHIIEPLALPVPVSLDELEAFEHTLSANASELAALMVEPLVQGTGGMRLYPPEVLSAMAALCREHDILLIADEIMTGFGRTGQLFACEEADVVPDILCLGKGVTGGMITLAATLATESVYEAFYDDDISKALMHGPTFMASPLACAIANASLDLFVQEPRLEQVAVLEAHFRESLTPLKRHSIVKDVRMKGAIGVVQLDAARFDPFAVRPRFVELGCWLRPFKDMIYLMPPFVIAQQELAQLTDAVCHVVEALEHEK